MLIHIGADEMREAHCCRMKAVACVLSRVLKRSVWTTWQGLWVIGQSGGALIEWDSDSRQRLAAFLAGETEDVELEINEQREA